MNNRLPHILFSILGLVLLSTPGYGQLDSLSDQDLDEIGIAAQECFSDYETTMKDLTNPTLDNMYRDAIVSDGKKSFVDGATIAVDYDSSYIPPFLPNDKEVGTYLTNFNVFFKENSLSDRIKIYYTNREYSKVMWDAKDKYYYLTLHYTSRYGDQLPQKRTATFKVDKTSGKWKALITYIKFQGADREEELFAEKKILAEPEWRILARQAEDSLNNQNVSSAFALLQQSLALDTTAFNLRIMGRYYQEKGELEQALEQYEKSLMKGKATDTAYQDSTTLLTIKMIHEDLEKQNQLAEKKENGSSENLPDTLQQEAASEASSKSLIDLNRLASGGKRGKAYTIDWHLPEANPVTVSLMHIGGNTQTVKSNYVPEQLTFTIGKKTKPGKYEIIVLDEQKNVSFQSPPFRINRKLPMGVKLGISVAVVGGYLGIAKQEKIWPFKPDKIITPIIDPEQGNLPEPPLPSQ